MTLARLLALLLPLTLVCTSPARAIPADESPEGWWAPSLKACRDPEASEAFEVRLKAQEGRALEGAGNRCRITRVSDTAIGYRLDLRCYDSAEDKAADRDARTRQIVVDAIGPVTMRAEGRRVYRCAGRVRAATATPPAAPSMPAPEPAVAAPRMPDQAERFTEVTVRPDPAREPVSEAPMRFAALPDPVPPAETVPETPRPLESIPETVLPVTPRPTPPLPARSTIERPVWRGRIVNFSGDQEPGTIVVRTRERALYLVQTNGKAIRYRVAVGRAGSTWTGVERVTAKQTWPGWTPTPEMRRRRPGLPRHLAGGPRNPLGARALYLGDSVYRIHGTTEPGSIGRASSSGCFRMLNQDVIELYERVPVGTRVEVM